MENQLTSFLSIEAIIFSLTVYIFCQIVRTSIEKTFGKLKLSFLSDHIKTHIKDFWLEIFLPTFPIVTGGLAAWLLPTYPYPTAFAATLTARIFFGIVAGVMSGMVYKMAKFYLRKNMPENVKKKYSTLMGEKNEDLPNNADDNSMPDFNNDGDKLAVPNPSDDTNKEEVKQ